MSLLETRVANIRDKLIQKEIDVVTWSSEHNGKPPREERLEQVKKSILYENELRRTHKLTEINFQATMKYFSKVLKADEVLNIMMNENISTLEEYDTFIQVMGWYTVKTETAQMRELLKFKKFFNVPWGSSNLEHTDYRTSIENFSKFQKHNVPMKTLNCLAREFGFKETIIVPHKESKDRGFKETKVDYQKARPLINKKTKNHSYSNIFSYWSETRSFGGKITTSPWYVDLYHVDFDVNKLCSIFDQRTEKGFMHYEYLKEGSTDIYEAAKSAIERENKANAWRHTS